jgi:hypothetical protein
MPSITGSRMMNNQFYGLIQSYVSFTRKIVKLNFWAGAVLQGTRKTEFSGCSGRCEQFYGLICILTREVLQFYAVLRAGCKTSLFSFTVLHTL